MKLLAAEAGELDVMEGPIELDVFSSADLFRGSLDDSRCEEVDG